MFIDIVFALILLMAIIKGYRNGLLLGVFSVVAFIVGLAAAMKLSAVVAGHIGKATNISSQWLPVLSFIAVFIVVVLLIKWGAMLLQKAVEFSMLGWVNKLAGILLFAFIYLLIYSILIFYVDQLHLLKEPTKTASITYNTIQPLGQKVMDNIGKAIPFFENMFTDLKYFFESISKKLPATS